MYIIRIASLILMLMTFVHDFGDSFQSTVGLEFGISTDLDYEFGIYECCFYY